jgi:heat shock transcription factor
VSRTRQSCCKSDLLSNSFVDKDKNHDLIRWSNSGDSFIVLDEDEFAKTLIPELFKHNNYASFVRQLNMYGFHKKVGLSDNSMKASERKNKSPNEYAHPFFKRGKNDYLWLISKPRNNAGRGKKGPGKTEDGADRGSDDDDRYGEDNVIPDSGYQKSAIQAQGAGTVGSRRLITSGSAGTLQNQELTEVQRQLREVQSHQRLISMTLNRLRKDHDTLLENVAASQDKHNRHENSINAILTFLATVYNRSGDGHGLQHMANMFTNAIPQDVQNQGNVVDVGDYNEQSPPESNQRRFPKRQPLLLGPPSTANGQAGRASTVSPGTSASSPRQTRYTPRDTDQSGTIEELANSPQPDSSFDSNEQYQQHK